MQIPGVSRQGGGDCTCSAHTSRKQPRHLGLILDASARGLSLLATVMAWGRIRGMSAAQNTR
jgi:hypothetical protein